MVGRNNPSNLLKGKLAVRYFSCHRLENNNKTHPRRVESSPCVFFLFSEGRLRNVHGHNEGHLDSTNPSIPRGAFRCRWVLEPPFFAPINARKYHGVTGVKCHPQPCPRSYKKKLFIAGSCGSFCNKCMPFLFETEVENLNQKKLGSTLPKTNNQFTPENRSGPRKETSLSTIHFQVRMLVSGRVIVILPAGCRE